ncbi:aftiphilin [Takifugu flavidus]|nr:aftiphilin [Takifugu flavidus]XP_056903133.1 aftiphilin [Takifugu flavidus]XP_056903134.1 aftiphilin [Takifugu flavidus]
MEPADISPLRCPSPAPLDGVGHPEVESKEEELRGFVQLSVGVSCRPPGSADSPESTSCLRQPLPIKPATHQSGCGLNLPVKQSQPTFSMNLASGWNETDMEHQALKAESAVRLIDDYRSADTCVASAANARLQREEMGFADFTVFTEQTVHHWCCGFTPSGNPETSNSRLGQRNPSNSPLERPRSPGQVALGDSDPHCSSKAKDCTMIGHWQEGDAAVAQPHQDQQQPQETAATLVFPPAKDHVEKGASEENDPTPEVREEGGEESAEQDEPGRRHSDSSATQENSATSGPLRSGARHDISDPVHAQRADAAVLILGTLPPSDSFADFCAAPAQDDGEDLWAEFTDRKEEEGEPAWTRERAGSVPTEDEDEAPGCKASLSGRVHQLFLANFLETGGPCAAPELEVLSLAALLDVQRPPQREDGEEQQGQGIQKGLRWLRADLHSAVGLRFQWRGSHSSRTLLRCLGVDAENVRSLETTKDSGSAARSPRHTAAPAPPTPQDAPAPSTAPVQGTIPSSQTDWNNRGLRSSQDGTCLRRAPHFWGRK